MKSELSDVLKSSVGLRVLNECLQSLKVQFQPKLSSVPPILLLDAIWVSLLKPSGESQRDKKGCLRLLKVRHKVPVLVALGVWGKSKCWEVLDQELVEKESQADWEPLLVRLETRGIYCERGLELIVHDGGKGLITALNLIYPHVLHQRCVFHQLRNVWKALMVILICG